VALFAIQRDAAQVRAASVADKPLTPAQDRLLELAFRAASALPENPHAKTRGRLQGEVVEACFALDAPRRALACAEKIQDWRRGMGYADFACYSASHGLAEEVPHYLELANQIAEQGEPLITQDWQKGRILVSIAKAHAWLGHANEAAALENGLEHSEMGKVDAVRALRADAGAFDEQLRALKRVFEGGDLDLCKNAFETCARLFDRYYEDPEKRARVEETVAACPARLPVQVRMEAGIEFAGIAIGHADSRKALELVDSTRALLDGVTWLPENYIPLAARLAALRFRAGAKEAARLELQDALEHYERDRAGIVDIYRAGALRPLAEAWESMGQHAAALAAYERVVEEGVGNPNSRPRAEDLVATCLSLARNGIEPDEELWGRLTKVSEGLGQPW
jgi:tetratricopeptide (TPR) repeat protein